MRAIAAGIIGLLALLGTGPALAQVRDESAPMSVVQSVDLNRYLGRWYEIARFPNRFERGCEDVTADYGLREDGRISVVNTCVKEGVAEAIEGQAWVVAPGQLMVTFVPWLGSLAAGDYWVLHLEPDYSMAVVGAPTGSFGWILSRKPQLSKAMMQRALDVFAANGYDTAQLEIVAQSGR
jgi:apolipoprotein D and lipocalin family protein